MQSYCRYLLPLLLVSAGPASAQLTLPQAVTEALAGNPELQAARQKIKAATGRTTQARAWPNPELELEVDDLPTGQGGFSAATYWAGVSQTVPFPGKKALDGDIGRKETTVAEAEYRAREIELVREVTASFCRVLAAEKKLAVASELLELNRSLAKAARQRVAAGAAGEQEALRAEIEQDRAQVEVTAAQRDVGEVRQVLARLLGRPHAPLGALAGELRERTAADLAQWRAQMLDRHPDLKAALANRERAELELRRAKREPWPDVTVGLAGGRDTREDETLVALRLSVPLPLFDRAQGRQREARALAEMARFDLSATEQRLVQDFELAGARLRAAGDQVEAYRVRILPKAEEALKLVRGGFDAGKFGFLDLVDTQRTLAEARLAYLDKLLELNLALADLEALAGTTVKE